MRFDKIKKRQEEAEFQIAPMIDVVFLLLIFFICAAQIKKLEKELKISLPDTSEQKNTPSPLQEIIINVKRSRAFEIEGRGALNFSQIKKLFKGLHETDPEQLIIIRGDEEALHVDIVKILDLCAEIGLEKTSVAMQK
jgi:biopolymer transport protein ExbD